MINESKARNFIRELDCIRKKIRILIKERDEFNKLSGVAVGNPECFKNNIIGIIIEAPVWVKDSYGEDELDYVKKEFMLRDTMFDNIHISECIKVSMLKQFNLELKNLEDEMQKIKDKYDDKL